MFREATACAQQFTRGLVICARTVSDKCKSGVAAYTVLNNEGWVLTAFHNVKDCATLRAAEEGTRKRLSEIEAVKSDASLSAKARSRELKQLGKPKNDDIQNYASWWGLGGAQLVDIKVFPQIDLAVGRLDPFDPSSVSEYPLLKDPTKSYDPGTSLCKLGYPFYEAPITWDDTSGSFVGANIAFPLFPIEGMLTRFIRDPTWAGIASSFPLLHIETSTPGLKGQSGGPIFDVQGRVWGIQCATASLLLGFEPEVKDKGGKSHRVHQFLNVGRGVHTASIVGFLTQHGIKFELSKD